jgi:hypothetical protein
MFKKLIEQDTKHTQDDDLINAFKEALEMVENGTVLIETTSEESEQL